MNQTKKIIIMAGGTGGHVFPGLTISLYLIEKGWKIRWLGTEDRMESTLVPKYGIKIDFIRISSLREKSVGELLLAPIRILRALHQARSIMKIFKPDVVLGMGGYISGPGGIAAWSLGIPIVLHEQNNVAGITNRYLSKIASKTLQAFPGALSNAEVVGNPIRLSILALPKPEIRMRKRNGPIRILIIGGSQGSHILNHIMPKVALQLGNTISVWHQSGKESAKEVKNAYISIGNLQYKVSEFIENIAEAYAWADIVVCRAGAMTVSEIAIVGLAALFVPFQHKDRQQYWNALPLEKIGAAKIFEQSQFTVDMIVGTLRGLNRTSLLTMAMRARSMAIPGATERIAKEIILTSMNA